MRWQEYLQRAIRLMRVINLAAQSGRAIQLGTPRRLLHDQRANAIA